MSQKKTPKQIAKFIAYVLGRRPDEFGLVPDAEGFVKIKALLQALGEEPGWGFVRRSHLNEIRVVFPEPVIEIRENLVRAADRRFPSEPKPAQDVSGQLFTCIRRRAYAHCLEKGISSASPDRVFLSDSREMALRMGRRLDPDPVLLTVSAQEARHKGVVFFRAGDALYLADQIPAGCFSGPPLPKERVQPSVKPEPEKRISPGSFFLDLGQKGGAAASKEKPGKGRGPTWKRDRKRLRKEKEKLRLKGGPSFVLGDVWGEDG